MTTHHPNRIIVTPKGMSLQVQLLREVTSTPSQPTSPLINFQAPNQPKTLRSSSSNTPLPPYFFPCRSGYFGPKQIPPSEQASLSNSTSQEHSFYPNYLKRDAKEYPAKHVCSWKPKSTIIENDKMEVETAYGKYMHHTLFNETISKFNESPKKVKQLNNIVYGNSMAMPMNLAATDAKLWDKWQKNRESDMRKSVSMYGTQTNFYSSKMGSTGFSQFSIESKKEKAFDERMLNKRIESEMNYQRMLVRFDEEARKKRNKYEEQDEAPDFQKKLKAEEATLRDIDSVKMNEDLRFERRLEILQKRKYENVWKKHEEFFGKSSLLSNTNRDKPEEVKSKIPFSSARDGNISVKEGNLTVLTAKEGEKSVISAKAESPKKVNFADAVEIEVKKQSEGPRGRGKKLENSITKKKVEMK